MEIGNSTTKGAQSKRQIFILSGQSNMAGRGGVSKDKQWDGVVPPDCQADPSSVHRLTAQLQWEPAREPLHADIDTKKACGVGPGMSFANAVKERVVVGTTMGLVPCAIGGTAIEEWARGAHLYEDMVKRAKAATEIDGGGEIKAVLWYQGESDTTSERDADSYKAKLERFILDLRVDLENPSLPIVVVAIGSGDETNIETVREAQKSVDLPNVVCVDAKGLPLKEDNLHLTTEAQVQLGRMISDAYIKSFCNCGR